MLEKSDKSLTFSAINNDGKEIKLRAPDLDAAQEEAADLGCLILYVYADDKKFGCCLSRGRVCSDEKIVFNCMIKVDSDPLYSKLGKSGKKITFGYYPNGYRETMVKKPSLEWAKYCARSSNCDWINVYVDDKEFGCIIGRRPTPDRSKWGIKFEDMKISLNTDEIYKLLERSGKNLTFVALNNNRERIKLRSHDLVAAQEEARARDLGHLYVYADGVLVGECFWCTSGVDKPCYSTFKRVYRTDNSAVYDDLEAIVITEIMA